MWITIFYMGRIYYQVLFWVFMFISEISFTLMVKALLHLQPLLPSHSLVLCINWMQTFILRRYLVACMIWRFPSVKKSFHILNLPSSKRLFIFMKAFTSCVVLALKYFTSLLLEHPFLNFGYYSKWLFPFAFWFIW